MNLINPILAQAADSAPELSGAETAAAAGAGIVMLLIQLAIVVFIIAAMWKVFTKAGKPGWAAIVPIYNLIVLCEIAGRPIWWFVLLLIPVVNIVVAIILSIDIAKSFGQGAGFGVGLAFLGFIFYPILGFGSAQYQGPAAAQA